VVPVLGALALSLGMDLLGREETARLGARVQLVQRVARWESETAGPAALASTVRDLRLRPDDPAGNARLLPRLAISGSGDLYQPIALLDTRGTIIAAYPAHTVITPGQLGSAWTAAWAGRGAVSPTFGGPGTPIRATVVPVGAPGNPWAVLVASSTEQVHAQLAAGLAAMLGAGGGTVSAVDQNGVVASSTDTRLVGRPLPAADRVPPDPPRAPGPQVWRTNGPGGEITHISAPTDTGYRVYFRQPTASLYADLRARGDRRTLLAVTLTAALAIAFVVLLRRTSARRSEARLRALFAAAHDIVLVTDPDGTLIFVSPAVSPLLGHSAQHWPGRGVTELVHPEDAARLLCLIADPGSGSLLNVRLVAPDGAARWFDVATRRLPVRGGEPAEILITCHAVGQRKRLLDQLGHQADHDVLTGLLNRSAFATKLDEALSTLATAATPHPPHRQVGPIAVLFLDLDRFKPVNDEYGHVAGDRVLQVVGQRIQAQLGPHGVGGRFGGDEFGILLTETTSAAARELASRVIRAVSQPITVVGDHTVRVETSVGIALVCSQGCDADWLLRVADQAMYQAKQAGPGRYAVAPPVGPRTVAGRGSPPVPPDPATLRFRSVRPPRIAPGLDSAATPGATLPAVREGSPPPTAPPPAAPTPIPDALPLPTPSTPSRPEASTVRRQAARQRLAHAPVHLFRALPLLVIGTVILTTTLITMEVEDASRQHTDNQRMAETHALAESLAGRAASLSQPRVLIDPVSALPWSLTDNATDDKIVQSLAGPQWAASDAFVALVDADGQPLSSTRPDLPITVGSTLWESAREYGLNVPVLDSPGRLRMLTLVPIRRDTRTRAYLVLGRTLDLGSAGSLADALGGPAASPPPGLTVTIVNGQGRVVMSSDMMLAGQILVGQADLQALRPGRSGRVTLRESRGGGRVAAAAMIPAAPMPAYLVLQQNPEATREGPQPGWLPGDLLVGLLALATGGGLLWALLSEDRTTRREGARLQTLLHESHDIIISLNRAGTLVFVSSAIEGLLGYQVDDQFGRPLLDLIHPDDRPTMSAFLAGRAHGGPSSLLDVRMRASDGRYLWFDIEAGCSQHTRGYLGGGLLLTCHEIGERRRLQEQLRERATHDPLTGLPNRAALTDRLDELARQRSPFTILLIDLDEFKPVNDTYGHQAGDEVLRLIAARLAHTTRTLAGPASTVFRFGGDEFVLVLPDIDADARRTVAARVREAIAVPVSVGVHLITVRATIGVASSRSPDSQHSADSQHSPDLVVRRADAHMYEAKQAARASRAMDPAAS